MSEATPVERDALVLRYQRLVLINRMASALFADKPFAEALTEACHATLALTGARAVAVHFADELGALKPAARVVARGWEEPSGGGAEAAAAAAAERRIVARSSSGVSWEAVPLLRVTAREAVVEGVTVFAHGGALSPDPDRETVLVEIARHLRNARQIQRSLQQQKVFAATFERSADALFVTDLDHRILSWNAESTELFGWSADEAVGRDGAFLVPPEREAEVSSLIERVLAEGQVHSFETERLRKDGTRVAVEGSFAALLDAEGKPFGVFRSYRDITKRKELERVKSEFVSLVSHELRTPLTAIRGFAEMIFDFWGELDEEKKRHYLGIILDETKRLSQLVTNFLDIARLEGGVELSLTRVELPTLAVRLTRLFEENSAKAAVRFEFGPRAAELMADEEQLYRLLVNLIGNGLKYAPAGSEIRVSTAREQGSIVLRVDDQGPGVAPKDRARLFEKFFRAGDPVSRKTPGTGLGLAICKGIAEAHGGGIRVDAAPGGGARFEVRLPAEGPR
jgi:PAS domain S-box-containing protein